MNESKILDWLMENTEPGVLDCWQEKSVLLHAYFVHLARPDKPATLAELAMATGIYDMEVLAKLVNGLLFIDFLKEMNGGLAINPK